MIIMRIEELIGKTITNIYILSGIQQDWLDKSECFIELDDDLVIDIPFGFSDSVWIKELDPKAKSIFFDLSDHSVYYINKEEKSIGEIAEKYLKQKRNIFNKIIMTLFGKEILFKEYRPYKIEYKENKLRYIQNRKIIDYLWYNDDLEKGYFELDNGYLISETTLSPSGTGFAGLNYYTTLMDLKKSKGNDFNRLTEKKRLFLK